MRSVVAILVLAAAASAFDIQFKANVTANVQGDLQFRRTGSNTFAVPKAVAMTTFYSLNGAAAASLIDKSGSATGNADSIWALAGVYATRVPTTWYGFWNAAFNAGMSVPDVASVDVSGSAGFIGTAYLSLTERDAKAAMVQTMSLAWDPLASVSGGLDWAVVPTTAADGLRTFRIKGTKTGSTLEITMTFMTSNVTGVVNYGSTIVAPKVLETTVAIKNWPYKDAANTLELRIATATAGATPSAKAVVTNVGATPVSIELKAEAQISGTVKPVTVTAWATADATAELGKTDLPSVVAKATATAEASIKCYVSTVTFPAGAADILYDPASYQGSSPYTLTAGNAAGSAVPAALLAFAAAVLAVLA